jgi:hypothetical protein
MRPRGALLLVAAILAVGVGVAQTDEWGWRRVAWEGRSVWSVVCPPDSSDVVYITGFRYGVVGESTGVYKSTDGGATWRYLLESANPVCDIVTIDPKDQAVVFCGSYSYWHGDWAKVSRDAGQHWEQVENLVDRIVPSPWQPGHLLATQTFNLSYSLHRSTDEGGSWQGICGSEVSHMSDNVGFHWEDSLLVFAGVYPPATAPYGLGRSNDGGFTWEVVLEGEISAFDQDPFFGPHWAAVEVGDSSPFEPALFAESFDNGTTWRMRALPDNIWYVKQLVFDLFEQNTIYLVDPRTPRYGAGHLGVYRTVDGGGTWDPMNEGLADPSGVQWVFALKGKPGELLAATTDGLWRWTDQEAATDPTDGPAGTLRLTHLAPCPFHETIRADLILDRLCWVEAGVYSLRGALVRNLFHHRLGPGEHALLWDGNDALGSAARPGAYLLVVRTGGERLASRLVKVD